MATEASRIVINIEAKGATQTNKSLADVDKSLSKLGTNVNSLSGKAGNTTQGLGKLNKATKDFNTEAQGATSATNGMGGALKKLGIAGAIVGSVVAIGKGIEEAGKAFASAEISAVRLSKALEMRGLSEASGRFEQLSKSIQNLTGIDGDYVNQLSAELIAQGKSEEMVKRLITAGADLASVTGQDLGSAVQSLNESLSGTARGLSKINPEIKDMTEEQLKAGGAIDVISEKYAGMAQAMSNTLEVSSKVRDEAVGDLVEAFGGVFKNALQGANELITNISRGLTDFINGISGSSKETDTAAISIQALSDQYSNATANIFGILGAVNESNKSQKISEKQTKDLLKIYPQLNGHLQANKSSYEDVTTAISNLNKVALISAKNQLNQLILAEQIQQSVLKNTARDTLNFINQGLNDKNKFKLDESTGLISNPAGISGNKADLAIASNNKLAQSMKRVTDAQKALTDAEKLNTIIKTENNNSSKVVNNTRQEESTAIENVASEQQELNSIMRRESIILRAVAEELDVLPKKVDQAMESLKDFYSNLEDGFDKVYQVARSIGDLMSNLNSQRIMDLEAQNEAQNKADQDRLKSAEEQGASEEELAKMKEEFSIAQEARELNLEKEKRKAAYETAVFNKSLAIAQATVAFFGAIIKGIQDGNIPGGIATSLAAGINLAAAIATPIPAAQFGGSFEVPQGAEGDSGLLRVNSGEQVTVEPTRSSGASGRYVLSIGGQEFDAYIDSQVDRAINSGRVTLRRGGVIRSR